MQKTRVLLFEQGDASESVKKLRALFAAVQSDTQLLCHEQQSAWDAPTCTMALRVSFEAFRPDFLMLVIAADNGDAAEALVAAVPQRPGPVPIVVVIETERKELIHILFQIGASDVLVPPLRDFEVWPRLQRILRFQEHQRTAAAQIKRSVGLEQLIGESPALMEQVRRIPAVAQCDATVLITGETGTGKELFARAVHYLGPRSGQPFVAINCGAIPVDLVENELFGHEAGAYTNANGSARGVVREADGGTLFLDEIDTLPMAAQVKLLRFLQDKEVRPLGARKGAPVDVRIVAASNAQLSEAVTARRFREDLYYRVNVLRLDLPPLRERADDIALLARHFLSRFAAKLHKPAREFAPDGLRRLSLHTWPGNVRELENVIERAVVLSTSSTIHARDIDVPVQEGSQRNGSFRQMKAALVAEFESGYLIRALENHNGNIAKAAEAAQKNRRAFFQLMRKYRIRVRPMNGASLHGVDKVVIEVDKKIQSQSGARSGKV